MYNAALAYPKEQAVGLAMVFGGVVEVKIWTALWSYHNVMQKKKVMRNARGQIKCGQMEGNLYV